MKKFLLLSFGLLAFAMPARALHVGEALELLKMDNEQVMSGIEDDQFAVDVVAKLVTGDKVSPADRSRAFKYCADTYSQIETAKLRSKVLKRLMRQIDAEIMDLVMRGPGSSDAAYRAGQHSRRIKRRLSSLLKFEAERYRLFLKILKEGQ